MAEKQRIMSSLIPRNTLIVICGPTASGKTKAGIELSKYLDIEIISADSRQVYKYLDIGTAKVSKDDMDIVPHHFIDIVNPDDYFSAGMFGNQAEKVALDILNREKVPVVVGGSGFYIKALCEGLFEAETTNEIFFIREKLNHKLKIEGIDSLFKELEKVDPESASKYSDKNPRRIIRALEFYYATGGPISLVWENDISNKKFNVIYFGISILRSELKEIISDRTEIMWYGGLVEETKRVLEMGYSPKLNSLNTVGYKECIAYLNGKLTEEEAIAEIKKNTNRYAKRQMTWFRGVDGTNWLYGHPDEVASAIPEKAEEITENRELFKNKL